MENHGNMMEATLSLHSHEMENDQNDGDLEKKCVKHEQQSIGSIGHDTKIYDVSSIE